MRRIPPQVRRANEEKWEMEAAAAAVRARHEAEKAQAVEDAGGEVAALEVMPQVPQVADAPGTASQFMRWSELIFRQAESIPADGWGFASFGATFAPSELQELHAEAAMHETLASYTHLVPSLGRPPAPPDPAGSAVAAAESVVAAAADNGKHAAAAAATMLSRRIAAVGGAAAAAASGTSSCLPPPPRDRRVTVFHSLAVTQQELATAFPLQVRSHPRSRVNPIHSQPDCTSICSSRLHWGGGARCYARSSEGSRCTPIQGRCSPGRCTKFGMLGSDLSCGPQRNVGCCRRDLPHLPCSSFPSLFVNRSALTLWPAARAADASREPRRCDGPLLDARGRAARGERARARLGGGG